jgi:hypothetical protein
MRSSSCVASIRRCARSVQCRTVFRLAPPLAPRSGSLRPVRPLSQLLWRGATSRASLAPCASLAAFSRKPKTPLGITPPASSVFFLVFRMWCYAWRIPARRGRLQENWPEARGRERRLRARANSLCARAASGSPRRTLRSGPMPSEEGEGARCVVRRRGGAPRGERASVIGARDASSGVLRVPRHGTQNGAAIRTSASRRSTPSCLPSWK